MASCWPVWCIMLHYFCFHSSDSGSKCKHVVKYLYTAILCSIQWFEKKLIVVLVFMGLHYMSSLIVDSLRINSRSKKIHLSVIFICWNKYDTSMYVVPLEMSSASIFAIYIMFIEHHIAVLRRCFIYVSS
jgi:hypothetical protein